MRKCFKILAVAGLILNSLYVSAQLPKRSLDDYLKQAESSSPVLKDLNSQLRSATIDSMIVRATAKPQVTGTSSGLYAPVIRGYGFDEVLTNGQALEALLNVNYDLLNKKRIQNQLAGIKIQRDSITYARQLSRFDLSRSIADQYILAFASQQQVAFDREVVDLLRKEEQLLKSLTRSNIYKQSEYLTFLVTLQQQELVVNQSDLQFKNDLAVLNYLSGIADTSQVTLVVPQLEKTLNLPEHGFFTRRFELDSLKTRNQKAAIDLNYKPRLGVYANGGYNSSLVLQPYKNFGTSIGFTFSIPIYDGNQRKMQYEKIALSSGTISNYREFFIRQQRQQLNLIIQQIQQTDALFGKINDQIRFSKGLIEVDRKLLHTGDLKVADFVIAINNYMSAQNLLRQATISRLKLLNQYNYWNK